MFLTNVTVSDTLLYMGINLGPPSSHRVRAFIYAMLIIWWIVFHQVTLQGFNPVVSDGHYLGTALSTLDNQIQPTDKPVSMSYYYF